MNVRNSVISASILASIGYGIYTLPKANIGNTSVENFQSSINDIMNGGNTQLKCFTGLYSQIHTVSRNNEFHMINNVLHTNLGRSYEAINHKNCNIHYPPGKLYDSDGIVDIG